MNAVAKALHILGAFSVRDRQLSLAEVAGPGERMPRLLVGSEMAARVVAAADAISGRLGYSHAIPARTATRAG